MPTLRFGRSFKAPDENGCQKKSVIWLIMAVGAADEVGGCRTNGSLMRQSIGKGLRFVGVLALSRLLRDRG